MKRYKHLFLFIILFLIFLFWGLFITDLNADEVWNYGFSYSIYKGFLPYKDFNMIITPLYPFFNALVFKIFGFNMLVFHITNSLMLTTMSYLTYKLIKEKFLLVLLVLFLPIPSLFPNYNLAILFLFILLMYLEKNKKNDIIIGIVIGLAILTKQSIGVCLVLPSLYYFKDIKKISKRILGIIIPISIFVLYLLISNTMMEFLDLCVFGLFDFTKNTSSFNVIYILSFIYILFSIYMIYKDKKNINNYYALAMLSITLPLFDLAHFQLSLFALLVIIFMNYDIKVPFNLKLLFIGIVLGIGFIQFFNKLDSKFIYPNNIKNFEYRLLEYGHIKYTNEINKYLDKHKDRKIIFFTNNAYYIKISRNEKLTKLDLINNGNHGYNGNDKLMKLVKENKDALFVINKVELNERRQTNKNIIKYVLKNGQNVDKICGHDVYILTGEYKK